MPQVQILEANPGFGSRLGEALGSGIGEGLSTQLQKHLKNQENSRTLESLTPLAKSLKIDENEWRSIIKGGADPKVVTDALKIMNDQQIQSFKQDTAQFKERAKEEAEQEQWEDIFKGLEERLPLTGTFSAITTNPWGDSAKEQEYFDILAFQLERFARNAHTKGVLSTQVFNSLMKKIPNSRISEAKNRGRMEAWKEVILKNKGPEEGLKEPKESMDEESTDFVMMKNPETGEVKQIPKKMAIQAQRAGGILVR